MYLLICTSIKFSLGSDRPNSSSLQKRIRQSCLSVILTNQKRIYKHTYNMSDDTHIPDICRMVHQFTELFRSKVDHRCQKMLSLDVSKLFLNEKAQKCRNCFYPNVIVCIYKRELRDSLHFTAHRMIGAVNQEGKNPALLSTIPRLQLFRHEPNQRSDPHFLECWSHKCS